MGWFVLGIILLIAGVVGIVLFVKARKTLGALRTENAKFQADYQQRTGMTPQSNVRQLNKQRTKVLALGLVGGGFLFLGAFTIVQDSYVIVPARNVGVVNILGNANSSLSNGFHPIAPWADVENVDTTNKPLQLNDDGDVANGCTSVPIRLASQQIACQDVFVQWQIDPKGDANDLWKTYRGSNDDLINNLQNNVILPRLKSEMQKAFSTYDPLQVLQGGQLLDTTTLQKPVEDALKGDMPSGVLILDVRFAQIHYSAQTQGKIDSYSQAVADTKIAVQNEQTATAQAAANKILATDPSINSAGVQYQNCLNTIANLASKGQLVQLQNGGFFCAPANSSVIVGNTGK